MSRSRSKDITPQPAQTSVADLGAVDLAHTRGWGVADRTADVVQTPGFRKRIVAARNVRRNLRFGWEIDPDNADIKIHEERGGEETLVMRIPEERANARAEVHEQQNRAMERAHVQPQPDAGFAGDAHNVRREHGVRPNG